MEPLHKQTAMRIRDLFDTVPGIVLQRQFALQPGLKKKYGERQIQLYLEDTRYHLRYLAESISVEQPELFSEYLGWVKVFFADLPVSDEEILLNLDILKNAIVEKLSPDMSDIVGSYIDRGIASYNAKQISPGSFIARANPLRKEALQYLDALIRCDKDPAQAIVMKLMEQGRPTQDIYIHIFQAILKETGSLWQQHKISVAQEHFITAATQVIMSQLYAFMFSTRVKGRKIFVTCVEGELHEIGARMVADFFEMAGWDSYYFGANTPHASLLSSIELHKPDVVAISATMIFNISSVEGLIGQIRQNESTKDVKILVGGYPFNVAQGLWKTIGADGHAEDALRAIELAKNLVN